jgi:hypothetical protein
MTTIRELYHMISNIEAQGEEQRRDLTADELDQISSMQDQIADIEHPGYEMKAWYETVAYANDTLSFNVISKEDGVPVDCLNIPHEGDKFLVRGYWKSHKEATEYAEQVLSKWFK